LDARLCRLHVRRNFHTTSPNNCGAAFSHTRQLQRIATPETESDTSENYDTDDVVRIHSKSRCSMQQQRQPQHQQKQKRRQQLSTFKSSHYVSFIRGGDLLCKGRERDRSQRLPVSCGLFLRPLLAAGATHPGGLLHHRLHQLEALCRSKHRR